MQAGHGAEDRGEYQRDHDHLQQLHITVAHQVEPANRGFQHRITGTVDGVQRHTKRHAQHQGEQDFFRQAKCSVAGLCETKK
ncbi:hypothetical protein D3C76_1566950 [compost metagenome]